MRGKAVVGYAVPAIKYKGDSVPCAELLNLRNYA